MMSGNFLLDTNIVIALFANEATVIAEINKGPYIFIPSIVAGELFYGAFNSTKQQQNISKINDFLIEVPVLKCDEKTGMLYGSIKKELKDKGKPIPENDIWIVALALQHEMTMVSRDIHFKYITNLNLETW